MNVLDSNVEALAFNYLSFGLLAALNNLWTWLAVVTAALSFWKIRSAGCPRPNPNPNPEAQPSFGPNPVITPSEVTVEKTEPARQVAVTNGVMEDVEGVRKGKFTVYYEEDMQCTCEKREGLTVLTAWEEREGCETEWRKRWEMLLRLRNGESENGWYTWQDVTELNGNVVRLWDAGLGGSFASESCSNDSSCMHVW